MWFIKNLLKFCLPAFDCIISVIWHHYEPAGYQLHHLYLLFVASIPWTKNVEMLYHFHITISPFYIYKYYYKVIRREYAMSTVKHMHNTYNKEQITSEDFLLQSRRRLNTKGKQAIYILDWVMTTYLIKYIFTLLECFPLPHLDGSNICYNLIT